jgi:hypothetical protein
MSAGDGRRGQEATSKEEPPMLTVRTHRATVIHAAARLVWRRDITAAALAPGATGTEPIGALMAIMDEIAQDDDTPESLAARLSLLASGDDDDDDGEPGDVVFSSRTARLAPFDMAEAVPSLAYANRAQRRSRIAFARQRAGIRRSARRKK